MIEYNKVVKDSTEICLVDNGSFCTDWQITSTTTYPFATLVILGQFALFLLVIAWFRKL